MPCLALPREDPSPLGPRADMNHPISPPHPLLTRSPAHPAHCRHLLSPPHLGRPVSRASAHLGRTRPSTRPPPGPSPRTPAYLAHPPAYPQVNHQPRLPPHPAPARRTRAPPRSPPRRPAACRHPTAGEHQRTLAAHPARSPAPYRLPPPAPAALPHALSLPAHSPPYPGVNHQPRTPTQNLCYHPPPHRAGPCCLGRPRSPAYLASPHPAPARAARQQGESPAPADHG